MTHMIGNDEFIDVGLDGSQAIAVAIELGAITYTNHTNVQTIELNRAHAWGVVLSKGAF